jgi:nicotinic acid mononucleotide adenylyltransferase
MLGILLNGLVHYNTQIRQFAFSVIGKEIFVSSIMDLDEKFGIFKLISKKILTLLSDFKPNEIGFLANSSGFNYIYRFISDFILKNGEMEMPYPLRIAFFPGAFDPFSLSHKEIAKSIRDLGFEVYLAVDEFSWSKQTLPHLLRKNIINMSVADELGIYLYPENMPVNIANTVDLGDLVATFKKSKVYIVVGSDVVANASAYKKIPEDKSIFFVNHIIFERTASDSYTVSAMLEENIEKIKAEVIRLTLPLQFEDISSTQIRNCIDENRSIASLVDPLVEKYIYENGFYRREPQYKSVLKTISINIEIIEEANDEILEEVSKIISLDRKYVYEKLKFIAHKSSSSTRFILARDVASREILGFSAFHWVRSNVILNEFMDSKVSEYIRENAIGRIILVDGIFINSNRYYENLEQIILTETLAFCLSRDYDYAAFHNILENYNSDTLDELLLLQGFKRLPYSPDASPVYVVNMNSPCTLNLDIELYIKEPFRSYKEVHESVIRCRRRLQKALADIYPENLVLSFDVNIMNETLIRKICRENDVPCIPYGKLGDAMCVPFGSILKRYIVPNTVTKSLHSEKLFEPDVRNYSIGPYPNYLSLENQAKMLKSFNRPVILVDDILHKGYRIKTIDPILKKTGIDVKKIVIGILSGRGKEIMDIQNREVENAYFIPKLKAWFNENALYPFIGGDTLWRGIVPERNLIPSVNLILPYTAPTFIKNATLKSMYNLSEVCIENSIDLFTAIQSAYQEINERSLTMASLGEVFTFPKYPDHGMDMQYNLNLSPSHYLYNDLEQLKRLKPILSEK